MGKERYGFDLKKLIRRILLLIFIFAAAFGSFVVYQQYTQKTQQTDSYETMQSGTLAAVRLKYLTDNSNILRGYTQKMDVSTMRGCITPLSQEHKLSIQIDQAENVGQVSYEVRGLDGTRLVEDGVISGWETDGSTMKTQLQLSNLVDDGNEYQFVLCVSQKVLHMISGRHQLTKTVILSSITYSQMKRWEQMISAT